MIRKARNHFFCLRVAERQRARPFQTRVQMTTTAMISGLRPTNWESVLIDSISSNCTIIADMRLMAIDFGSKRVGVASTDEGGTFALPRLVLPNDEHLLDNILELKEIEGVEKIVIGESRNLDGSPNLILSEIEKFKKTLEERGVEVVLHPEVFTTMEARQIQGNSELTDASAAALILKNYIETMYNKENDNVL